MTKDKDGNYVFKEGKEYRMKALVNPVWMPNATSKCTATQPYAGVADAMGQFRNGDDVRWWVASADFEEVK